MAEIGGAPQEALTLAIGKGENLASLVTITWYKD